MSNFPIGIMSKNIKRETLNEVDNSPNIYNARDFNIDDRELLAIQKFLVGNGLGKPNGGMAALLAAILSKFRDISNNGLILQSAGSVAAGQTIPIPSSVLNTTTSGALTTGATTINVISTKNFPLSGFITKINNLSVATNSSNQEIIRYSGTTSTSFTGCTRTVEGNAQALSATDTAVILGGKASLFISLKSFVDDPTLDGNLNPYEIAIGHDAMMKTTGIIYSPTVIQTQKLIQIGYALSVVGTFADLA